MNVQKVSFKSKYIFPDIKSFKTKNLFEKNFVSTVVILADKRKEWLCSFCNNQLILNVKNKYDKNLEKIANFYNIRFIKK